MPTLTNAMSVIDLDLYMVQLGPTLLAMPIITRNKRVMRLCLYNSISTIIVFQVGHAFSVHSLLDAPVWTPICVLSATSGAEGNVTLRMAAMKSMAKLTRVLASWRDPRSFISVAVTEQDELQT